MQAIPSAEVICSRLAACGSLHRPSRGRISSSLREPITPPLSRPSSGVNRRHRFSMHGCASNRCTSWRANIRELKTQTHRRDAFSSSVASGTLPHFSRICVPLPSTWSATACSAIIIDTHDGTRVFSKPQHARPAPGHSFARKRTCSICPTGSQNPCRFATAGARCASITKTSSGAPSWRKPSLDSIASSLGAVLGFRGALTDAIGGGTGPAEKVLGALARARRLSRCCHLLVFGGAQRVLYFDRRIHRCFRAADPCARLGPFEKGSSAGHQRPLRLHAKSALFGQCASGHRLPDRRAFLAGQRDRGRVFRALLLRGDSQ